MAATIVLLSGCSDSPTQPVPDQVRVTPSAPIVQVGDSVLLSASYEFGATSQPSDGRIRWSTSDSSALWVDRAGYGHAVKYTGAPVTVIATVSGVSGTTELTVLPTFDSLVVTLSATLAQGRTVRPNFAIRRTDNLPYPTETRFLEIPRLDSKVQLSSSDTAAVSIGSDGSVHAVALGHATISAELMGKRSTLLVDVIPGYALRRLAGTADYTVKGVNDAGVIIAARASGGSDVLLRDGTVTDLGFCSARDINNAGQVACVSAGRLPAVYSNGTFTVLFNSPAYYSGASTGITESGDVFGLVRYASGTPVLFLATSSGITIPALDPCCWYGDSYEINSQHHAVVVDRAGPYPQSFIIGENSPIGLAPLSGRWSEARHINDADDVVGYSEGWGGLRGTVWRAANNWTPESPSYRAAGPVGISEAGQVVGNEFGGAYVWHAGRYTLLNDALADTEWTLTGVSAVSRSGIVAGYARNSAGAESVVLIDLGSAQ